MKIIQANAISLNGMIARENGEEDWLPSEGWSEFVEDVEKFNNFIMGRETYELVMKLYPDYNFGNVNASSKVIVSSQVDYPCPEGYIVVNNPQNAIALLESRGFDKALLIGGGGVNASFYEAGLVDEAWLTINPIILGCGRGFIGPIDIEVKLELIETIKLSKNRVQLKYRVKK